MLSSTKGFWGQSLFSLHSLAAATVIVLVLALLAQQRAHADKDAMMADLEEHALRSALADALLGRELPPMVLPNRNERTTTVPSRDRPTLAWIVDPAECLNCLDDVAEWNRFVRADYHADAVVIMLGLGPGEAGDLADRAGLRGEVLVASNAAVRDAFGRVLPSTRLLVNETGTIRLADTRSHFRDCEQKFMAQVSALRSGWAGEL